MAPIDLNLVRAFTAVHEAGSFSTAALKLEVPRSTVSRSVAALESALGTRLFQRTTRKVSTTSAGLALYDRLQPSLASLEASLAEVPEREEVPSGTLRVTSVADVGSAVLAEVCARFTARYPQTHLEVVLSNQVVDLVRDGFDFALRISLKNLKSSTLVSQRVGAISVRMYASPAYLARKGTPERLEDLAAHDFVVTASATSFGVRHVKPRLVVNEMQFLRETVKAGAGIGPLPSFLTHADVAAGALVRVLPKWGPAPVAVHLVQPSRKHQSPTAKAFRAMVLDVLAQRPL